tara:strand:+ start:114 stop:668 length:555 start_codon:yes stop_codon:yes gene_type:complete
MRYLIIAFSLLLFSCTSEKYEDKLLVCVVPSDSELGLMSSAEGLSNAMKVTLRKDNSGKGEHILKLDFSPLRQIYPDIDFDKYIEMDDSTFAREQIMIFHTRDIDLDVYSKIAIYRLMERYGLPLVDETEKYYMFNLSLGFAWVYLNKLPYELSLRLDDINADNEWETLTDGPFACTLNESDPL